MKKRFAVRGWACAVAVASVAGAASLGCGSTDDGTKLSRPDSGTTSTATLSDAFAERCSSCHGPSGEGMGSAPALPGSLDLDAFRAAVRAGRGSRMPSFTADQISDAELASDYEILSKR